MPEILKAFKYRLYPDKDQTVMLNKTFGCVRVVWNKLVDNFNSWTPDYMPPVMTEQTLKHQDEYDFLKEVSNVPYNKNYGILTKLNISILIRVEKLKLVDHIIKRKEVDNLSD